MSEAQPMIAQFWVRLNLIDEIKVAQDSDPTLIKLKDRVWARQENRFKVYQGVLKMNERLCVPDVNDLKQRILHEAYYASYNVHPRATKMYHDIKATYWWNSLKKDVVEFIASYLTYQ